MLSPLRLQRVVGTNYDRSKTLVSWAFLSNQTNSIDRIAWCARRRKVCSAIAPTCARSAFGVHGNTLDARENAGFFIAL
jgi:hypothetical protein